MSIREKLKTYSADKIALLVIFAVSLIIAQIIVVSRKSVRFSEPVILPHTGLSAAMPSGNGWKAQSEWKYQESSFILSSEFHPGTGTINAQLYCQYLLAQTLEDNQDLFKQLAGKIEGRITKTGQVDGEQLTFDYAQIENEQLVIGVFAAVVRLPDSRYLQIEIFHSLLDADFAEQVVTRTIEKINFEENRLIESGAKVIAIIKNSGIDYLLDETSSQNFFLVSDRKNNPIGFTSQLIDTEQQEQGNIKATTSHYFKDRRRRDTLTYFEGSDIMDRFVWKSQSTARLRRQPEAFTTTLDPNGMMTVKLSSSRSRTYRPGQGSIPEFLLQLVLAVMLDSRHEQTVIDLIESDGKIYPVYITKEKGKSGGSFSIDYLHDPYQKQQVETDGYGHILKSSFKNQPIVLDRKTGEEMLQYFPRQIESFIQKDNMFNKN